MVVVFPCLFDLNASSSFNWLTEWLWLYFSKQGKGPTPVATFRDWYFFLSILTVGNRPSLIYNSSEMLTCQSPLRVLSSLSFYIYALLRKFLAHYYLRPLWPTKKSNYPDLRYKQAIDVVPVPMARRLLVHVLSALTRMTHSAHFPHGRCWNGRRWSWLCW
jgi:hypothetical protein